MNAVCEALESRSYSIYVTEVYEKGVVWEVLDKHLPSRNPLYIGISAEKGRRGVVFERL